MLMETIFYVTGSLFFIVAIAMLVVFIYYIFKILQKIVDIENEIKETVSEVKTKITTFSAGIVGLTSLLEKVMDMKNKHDFEPKETENNNQEKEDKTVKKLPLKEFFRKRINLLYF